MLDSYNAAALRELPAGRKLRLLRDQFRQRAGWHRRNLRGAEEVSAQAYLLPRLRAFWQGRQEAFGQAAYRVLSRAGGQLPAALQEPVYACRDAACRYEPKPWGGRGLLFRVEEPRAGAFDLEGMGWSSVFAGGYELREVPGSHVTALREPHASAVAAYLEQALA